MSVYIRPFKITDLEAFVPIEPMAKAEIKDMELAKAIEKSGFAITGIRNGKIFGCGGVHPIQDRPSEGEMWLRLSKDCRKHRIDTMRWIKDAFKIIEKVFPFDVLHAGVRCCFKESAKMMEYLGFENVQKVEHEGQDWFLYRKRA